MRLQFTKRPGLVVYVTCGDPSMAVTRDVVLDAIDAGADVIELGVPFSDPVADGPVIQRASERALVNGTTLGDVLKLAGELRRLRPEAGLIVFSYLNPILRMGLAEFCDAAKAAGGGGGGGEGVARGEGGGGLGGGGEKGGGPRVFGGAPPPQGRA